jgi:protein SCO1/2
MAGLSELQARAGEIDRAAESSDPEKELSRFFRDDDPIYAGLGLADVDRIRGYALATAARVAPKSGLAAAREEIHAGIAATPLAAAGRLIAALDRPSRDWLGPLAAAATRIRARDQKVWLERIEARIPSSVTDTATSELARAFLAVVQKNLLGSEDFAQLIANAPLGFARAVESGVDMITAVDSPIAKLTSCCCDQSAQATLSPIPSPAVAMDEGVSAIHEAVSLGSCSCGCHPVENIAGPKKALPDSIWGAEVEDQKGGKAMLGSRLLGRPAVLAFFYTRCMNPLKCSRTITILAEIAKRAAAEGLEVGIFGVSYDPVWDTPARLTRYGIDRGMQFAQYVALLRTTDDWDSLREAFKLAVGYGPSTVNRHRIEVLVLDAQGRPIFENDGCPPEADKLFSLLKLAATLKVPNLA